MNSLQIGFIGQGFIGRNLADNFAERGYAVVRYALEPEYVANKAEIAHCDIVFIAVPTPTTPEGFDFSSLKLVLPLVGEGKTAVIKSTILPGTTKLLQEQFPHIVILHSPEFLTEKNAKFETDSPLRNIVGMPVDDEVHQVAAAQVMSILPTSPYARIVNAVESELIKYAGNNFLALKVVYMNIIYQAAEAVGANYEVVAEAMKGDPRIGASHMNVIDQSGHPGSIPGRGAGGHCFPKDWAAFTDWYKDMCVDDAVGQAVLDAVEVKNVSLLRSSQKDIDLLNGIYGA